MTAEPRVFVTGPGEFAVEETAYMQDPSGGPMVKMSKYLIGTFDTNGNFVVDKVVPEPGYAWYEIRELLERVEADIKVDEETTRKWYAKGVEWAMSERTRPAEGGIPHIWVDPHGLLIVENGRGRRYAHLQWSDGEGWNWAANMDSLPVDAQPVQYVSTEPEGLQLPEVEVYQGTRRDGPGESYRRNTVDHWFVLDADGDERDLTSYHDLRDDDDALDNAIDAAKRQLAQLLAIQEAEQAKVEAKIDGMAEWIKSLGMDIFDDDIRRIAALIQDRYSVEPRED
ncbi:hypothetical protein SEA_SCENTAE_73 [Gordonia phage SCentae]|nr:hypothetical protein SEA_SCENTAE_73 [Gordonia phage SCentae]